MPASFNQAIAARLGSGLRGARARTLTVDNTIRRLTLPGGSWRVYGAATQVYVTTRAAVDAAGTLATGDAHPAALGPGTAAGAAGFLWGTGGLVEKDATSTEAFGDVPLPTDPTDWIEIAIAPGEFANVYMKVASGTAAPVLVGPYGLP
jgi:hypothetical protein